MQDLGQRTAFGVTLATLGTMVSALGNHLIVKSHTVSKTQDKQLANLYLLAGNVCVVALGTVLGLIALAYAPQSLLSPLGGLTVVWNLLLATLPIFGGARPSPEEIVYTVMTLMGMALVVYMGPQNRGQKSSFSQLTKAPFMVIVVVYAAAIGWLSSPTNESKQFRRIAAGALGALVGGLSNVFAKSAVEFSSGNQVASEAKDYFTFGIIIMIALGLAIAQLMLLNSALANHTAIQVVPVYQTTLCIAATFSGGVAFDEFSGMSLAQGMMFVLGVIISAMGVMLSALRGSSALAETDKD